MALNAIGNLLLRSLGVNRQVQTPSSTYTPEELQLIVAGERGARARIRAESGQMLQELFEFGDLTAGEVMVPRVRVVGIPARQRRRTRSAQLLGRTPHTRYPVYEGDLDHIVGMIHIKDLLRLLLRNEPIAPATRGRCPSCPRPRRSTPCWRPCGASARRWWS